MPGTLEKRVRNHSGRLDVLASKLAGEIVRQSKNPLLQVAHQTLAEDLLDPLLHYYLGPRNRRARQVTRIVRKVVDAQKRVAAGRVREVPR